MGFPLQYIDLHVEWDSGWKEIRRSPIYADIDQYSASFKVT